MSVSVERSGAVTEIRLSGTGARNLATPELVLSLNDALVAFERDEAASVAILAGARAHFWGGVDPDAQREAFADMADMKGKLRHFAFPMAQDMRAMAVAWRRLFRWRGSKPVIAAIEGDCFDHGMVLLGVHTDLRIAARDARFGFPAIRRGDAAGEALASGLAAQIAPAWLNWMVETAEPIDAATAHRAWLINELVDDGDALDRARALALQVARVPAATLRAEKLGTRLTRTLDQDEALIPAIALARS